MKREHRQGICELEKYMHDPWLCKGLVSHALGSYRSLTTVNLLSDSKIVRHKAAS